MSATHAVKGAIVATFTSQALEPVVKTSMNASYGGLFLIGGVIIMAMFNWTLQGENNDQPYLVCKRVKVSEVAGNYKAMWMPVRFWPQNDVSFVTRKLENDFEIYRWVWTFLLVWLGCSGFFLAFAGIMPEIEVFREEAHLRAAACVSVALCLCAVWPILFCNGWTAQRGDDDSAVVSKKENYTKDVSMWLSVCLLLTASGFAVAGSATLHAWTLPGTQYGTLIFLGPGYGLFAGWIIFAAALNMRIAISNNSYPSGTSVQTPSQTVTKHRPNLLPVVVATILVSVALIILDPVIPLPFLLTVLFFTPRQMTHLVACGVCALGSAGAAWLVWIERT